MYCFRVDFPFDSPCYGTVQVPERKTKNKKRKKERDKGEEGRGGDEDNTMIPFNLILVL